ncbi:unnamed protein product [Ilex paraguariensis]|uniref:WAT1-related protein n=1 Tax=Ilex paraguariensis TaxID=185542 RepID=A0ABC8SXZ4_9AQUA
MSFVGAAQSAVFTVFIQRKRAAWTIGFNIDLWSTKYGVKEKGPVFVTMFNPLSTLLVAVLAYFVLDEKLYVGGGVVVIAGLYFLLWGKEHDQEPQISAEKQSCIAYEQHPDPKTQIFNSTAKDSHGEP